MNKVFLGDCRDTILMENKMHEEPYNFQPAPKHQTELSPILYAAVLLLIVAHCFRWFL